MIEPLQKFIEAECYEQSTIIVKKQKK
jgi:hypothetical protein